MFVLPSHAPVTLLLRGTCSCLSSTACHLQPGCYMLVCIHFLQSEFLRKVSVRRPFSWYCFYTDKSATNNDQRGAPPPLLSSSVHCYLSFWSAQWCPPKNLEKWTPEWRETSKEWFTIDFHLLLPNHQLPIYWLSTYWLPIYQTARHFQSIDWARTYVHQALSSF